MKKRFSIIFVAILLIFVSLVSCGCNGNVKITTEKFYDYLDDYSTFRAASYHVMVEYTLPKNIYAYRYPYGGLKISLEPDSWSDNWKDSWFCEYASGYGDGRIPNVLLKGMKIYISANVGITNTKQSTTYILKIKAISSKNYIEDLNNPELEALYEELLVKRIEFKI